MHRVFSNRFAASILLNSSYTIITRRPNLELLSLIGRYFTSTLNSQVIFTHGNICYSCGVIAVNAGVWEDKYTKATIGWFTADSSDPLLMTADHVIPLSANGSRCKTNLQPLCFKCNQTKANRKPMEFETQLVTQRKKILKLILECSAWDINNARRTRESVKARPISYDKLCLKFPGMEDEILNFCKKMV